MDCGCDKAKQLTRGVAGLAKAVLHIDRADDATIQARRDVCRGCEHASRNPDQKYAENGGLTTRSRCGKCGCFIAPKTVIAGEACPLEKWLVTTPANAGQINS